MKAVSLQKVTLTRRTAATAAACRAGPCAPRLLCLSSSSSPGRSTRSRASREGPPPAEGVGFRV